MKRINFYIDDKMLKQARSQAKKAGWSLALYIRNALKRQSSQESRLVVLKSKHWKPIRRKPRSGRRKSVVEAGTNQCSLVNTL